MDESVPIALETEEPKRRRGGFAGPIAVAIALIVAVLLIASPWFWALLGDLGGTREYDEGARLSVSRTIEFSVSGPGTMLNFVVDLPLPRNIVDASGGYVQESTMTDPAPTPLAEYKYGSYWMVWEGENSRGKEITIDYEFLVETVVWDMEDEESGTANEVPQDVRDRYLGEEWKIKPDEPEVLELADELTAGERTVRGALEAIYDYMTANLRYETGGSGTPKDCLQTLQDMAGDCDDQSILFCSLARAAGIPAWMEFGVLYDSANDAWGGHAWVKSYVPADGGGGAVCIDVVNKEFLVRPCNRFADWESDGNGSHVEDYYNTLVYNSTSQINLEYSEGYEGTYEPIGGKVSVSAGAIELREPAEAIARRSAHTKR
jgi:hypothetical protein